jgi:2,5-diketo-D-gluconate reductase B
MRYISLPEGRVPALGFGTWQLKGTEARTAVEHALDLGYRHLDTAQVYENEAEVGTGLKASGVDRGDVWLTTKVSPEKLQRRDVIESVEASLRRLGTDYVDLLLIHWPDPEVPIAETLGALQDLRDEGKTRYLGVSNFTPPLVREALEIEPGLITNQVEYHPYLSQEPLLKLLRERGMFLTAYSPIAQGEVMEDEVIQEIAEVHGKTPAQVVLRWHLQQDRVATIPRASSAEHREANFAVFDFELSDEEMERVHGLDRGERLVDPDFAPDWEEQ